VVRPRSRATAGGLFLLDYGTFYASKSFEIPNSGDSGWPLLGSARRGRRILWGWADETDTCGPWPACTKPGAHKPLADDAVPRCAACLQRWCCAAATGPRPPLRPRSWRGLQTLPRDVSYDPLNDVVLTLPVPELSALRTGLHAAASAHVAWPNRDAQCSSRQRGGKTVRRRTHDPCRALRNVSFQTPQSHQVHECVSETEFVRDDRGTMLPAQAAEFRATFSVRGQLDIASGCA